MNHKFILYTFALLFAACGNSPKRGGTTTIYTNPVITADAPDPSVIRTDDGSYTSMLPATATRSSVPKTL